MSFLRAPAPAPTLGDLPTPCLVLEHDKLAANLARMAAAAAARGVRLRPHLKTAKACPIAELAAPRPDGALTVSTLREAEYFAHHGWRDLFYAVGLGPGKFARAAALLRSGVRLLTMVDHPDTAARLADFARREGSSFRTVIEIDAGDARGGVPPESETLLAVAHALGRHFVGVATHGGFSYQARSAPARAAAAAREAGAARRAAARLREAGFVPTVVSVGSTPTALAENDLAGITELRAGVYMFGDLFQVGLGVCRTADLALSVLAEVIGRPADRPDEFLIDAGALALSLDTSPSVAEPAASASYGQVCDAAGAPCEDLRVARVWQEHGLVRAATPLPPGSFPIGSRVRVLPNHACLTAAAHDRYFVVDRHQAVIGEWTRVNGW